jgi:hypothetical protein
MPIHVELSMAKLLTPPAILVTLVVLAAAACAGDGMERAERFPYIHQPNFRVENPSRDHASATGIGCGGTEQDALMEARNTARFNLRGVTGNGNYKIRYELLREIPEGTKLCVEVKATAFDAV